MKIPGEASNKLAVMKENGIQARVVADSISPEGQRLISIEGTMARYVLAELNTHRMFSRNSASSRAIPVFKQIERVLQDPYLPVEWGKNKPGMSAAETLNLEEAEQAERIWRDASIHMILSAVELNGGIESIQDSELRALIEDEQKLKNRITDESLPFMVHKQIVNRLMEFAMHHTVLITATEWSNFFALRISKDAQPDLRVFAEAALEAIENSQPREVAAGGWHTPYVDATEGPYSRYEEEDLKKVATAKAARLSYLNQEQHLRILAEGRAAGKKEEDIMDVMVAKDIELHDILVANGHMSPLEHVATPFSRDDWDRIQRLRQMLPEDHYLWPALDYDGNFHGWHQYRKQLPFEHDFSNQLDEDALVSQVRIRRALDC